MSQFLTFEQAQAAGMLSARAYGDARDPPIGKSGMSRLIKDGLPVTPGKDAHGRDVKWIDPARADAWCNTYQTPKLDGQGRLRGLVSKPTPRSDAPAASTGPDRAPNPQPKTAARGAATAPTAQPRQGRLPPVLPLPGDESGANRAERIAEAKAQNAEDDAASRRMRRLVLEGTLMDRGAGLDVLDDFAGEVGKTIDRMPADMATHVAAAVGCDEHTAYKALKAVADRQRDDLERYARSAVARYGPAGGEGGLEDDPQTDPA